MLIGVRAAARKLGVNESTALDWSKKYNWEIPKVFNGLPAKRSKQISLASAMSDSFKEMGEETRLYFAAMALKASYQGAQLDAEGLLDRDTSLALHNHAKTADIVHGYTQHAPAIAVQINVEKSNEIRARFASDVSELQAHA